MPYQKSKGTVYGVEISEHDFDYSKNCIVYLLKYKDYRKYLYLSRESYYDMMADEMTSMYDGIPVGSFFFEACKQFVLEVEDNHRAEMGTSIWTDCTTASGRYYVRDSHTKPTKRELSVLEKLNEDVENWLKPARKVMYET